MHATTQRTGLRAGRASITARIALTVPSRALTGLPSAPLIDLGRAKNERYSSQGTSAISSGPGTGGGYALRVRAGVRRLRLECPRREGGGHLRERPARGPQIRGRR